MVAIQDDTQKMISWSLLAKETSTDAPLSHILRLLEQGTECIDNSDPVLASYGTICKSVYIEDGVLLYQDRVMVLNPSVTECSSTSMQLIKEYPLWNNALVQ